MSNETILVVEDEEDILELVRYNLDKEDFIPILAESGEDAYRAIQDDPPDLILLDLMLPGMDGLELCKRLKQDPETSEIPIVMLTARTEEADIVAGLELGAEDYITKPFSPKVMIARVRAVLRRVAANPLDEEETIEVHGLTICPGRHEVLYEDKPVGLTATEFRMLHYLARRPGWVFTRYQIVDAVRGPDHIVTDRAVDVHIAGLRKKLGQAGACIETVRGIGYRFKE